MERDPIFTFSVTFAGLGLLGILLGIPLHLGKVPRNRFYGFRTRGTLSDDRIWFPANKAAGKYLAISGAVMATLGCAVWIPIPGLHPMVALVAAASGNIVSMFVAMKMTVRALSKIEDEVR